MTFAKHFYGLALVMVCPVLGGAAELRVPASTAYLAPNPEGARVSTKAGITGWQNAKLKVLWFGDFQTPGKLTAHVIMRLPKDTESKLRLALGDQVHDATVKGAGQDQAVTLSFGDYAITDAGYKCFTLESLNAPGKSIGDIEALVLDGPATAKAHFNLEPRRNAASVHLAYPVPAAERIEWFYSEVTAVEDPVATFYMACGFRRGYFGMQVNSPTERRIIFSVWDAGAGTVAKDRQQVPKEHQVSLVAKGDDVHTSIFGNEGTGGHSHLIYGWKTGVPQRFLLTAQPDAASTIYSGYYFHPDKKAWVLIASMKAPQDGNYLKGLHGFSENFGGSTGHLRRKALYGNQWARTANGKWTELTSATFSHDATGKSNRLDRMMGVEENQFFLAHGGFLPGTSKSGELFTRPGGGQPPNITLPEMKTLVK